MGEYADYEIGNLLDDYWGVDEDLEIDIAPIRLHPIQLAKDYEWYNKEKQYIDMRCIDTRYAANIVKFIERSPGKEMYIRQRNFLKGKFNL